VVLKDMRCYSVGVLAAINFAILVFNAASDVYLVCCCKL
jgi:hypothetical protein